MVRLIFSSLDRRALNRPRSARLIAALCLASLVAGCAVRPGPEVLTPVLVAAPGARIETLYVATTRARQIPDSNIFTNDRARETNYAVFKISVPPGHQPGQIEWPLEGPNPAYSFATVDQSLLDKGSFERAVATRSAASKTDHSLIFVHGFNNNFQESLYRLAQMTADTNFSGAAVLFAWPSEAKATGYIADKDAVTASRDQLASLIATTAKSTKGRVTLLAHSMGSWLTMEALRQLRLTGRSDVIAKLDVVLASPDIDVDVFRSQLDVLGPLDPPMTILVSRDDIALAVSQRLADHRRRVGAVDIDDPRVQEAALRAHLRIVDISDLASDDAFHHDRFVTLAAYYPRLASSHLQDSGGDIRETGAFVFNKVGATLASPFSLAGSAIAGE